METLVLIVHVFVALAIVLLVLIQQGKGAEAGASFGSGASNTVFGSQGSASFLGRFTAGLVVIFFLTSFGLAILAKHSAVKSQDIGVPQAVQQSPASKAPAKKSQATDIPKAAPIQNVPSLPTTSKDAGTKSSSEVPEGY